MPFSQSKPSEALDAAQSRVTDGTPRLQEPRARDFAEHVMAAAWAAEVDALGAAEIGRLEELIERIDSALADGAWTVRAAPSAPNHQGNRAGHRGAGPAATIASFTSAELRHPVTRLRGVPRPVNRFHGERVRSAVRRVDEVFVDSG
jgi:hypothetical protein